MRLRIEPYTLGLLMALGVGVVIPVRGEAAQIADHATGLSIALLFFLHGGRLSRTAIVAGASHWRLHLLVLSMSFVLFPALGIVIAHMPGLLLSPAIATGFLFLTLLPSTVQSSIAFTSIARGNVSAAVCAASLSNLVGIFLTPALVSIFMQAHGSGVPWQAVQTILLELLVPFVAGHALRPLIGKWLHRNKGVVSLIDRGSILFLVYSAVSAATVAGLWHRVSSHDLASVVAVSGFLLAFMLVASIWGARRLGFAREDEIVVAFCGSKKSLASGVPIAGALFPAATIGGIILPLMIFHQFQLTICALLARRYAQHPADIAVKAVGT
jgi:sodium/bile acid cotransporter 7